MDININIHQIVFGHIELVGAGGLVLLAVLVGSFSSRARRWAGRLWCRIRPCLKNAWDQVCRWTVNKPVFSRKQELDLLRRQKEFESRVSEMLEEVDANSYLAYHQEHAVRKVSELSIRHAIKGDSILVAWNGVEFSYQVLESPCERDQVRFPINVSGAYEAVVDGRRDSFIAEKVDHSLAYTQKTRIACLFYRGDTASSLLLVRFPYATEARVWDVAKGMPDVVDYAELQQQPIKEGFILGYDRDSQCYQWQKLI